MVNGNANASNDFPTPRFSPAAKILHARKPIYAANDSDAIYREALSILWPQGGLRD